MANRRDDYMNKRSWLIDTAETPADKKKLKSDLAKLDKKFNPNRVASTSKSKPAAKTTGIQATKKAVEKAVGKAKLAASMGTTKKKMTVNKPAMKPGNNPKISAKTPMPKVGPKPTRTATPKPKTTKKPEKMTPQDAAMKKILEKKYGKIYG